MQFAPVGFDEALLGQYAALFARCFAGANHLDQTYLRWLYRENPAGTVVGFDAWEGERLAAHYACVPCMVRVEGVERRALLSLNTATHPDFQGQGLFTRLAEATYARGAELGNELVYGIANANSTPGFLRKLGFELVAPLDSWMGLGRLRGVDWPAVAGSAGFQRSWSEDALSWRLGNPARPVRAVTVKDGSTGFLADTGRAGIRAWAQLPGRVGHGVAGHGGFGIRVFLGKLPDGSGSRGAYLPLPERLRPSPLNMIVRSLGQPVRVDPRQVFFTFLDFDAF